jgi:hypothetical protein
MERAVGLAVLTDCARARVAALLLVLAGSGAAAAQDLTQEEALRRAFPEGTAVERRTAYLDDAQIARARTLAGRDVEIPSGIVSYYVGRQGGRTVGAAYFDAQRVRTLPQVLMIVVDPRGHLERIETIRWAEPPEYRPPVRWLGQFLGRVLDDELSERRGIAGITGATLTTRATTQASRRVLALHQVIAPFAAGSP